MKSPLHILVSLAPQHCVQDIWLCDAEKNVIAEFNTRLTDRDKAIAYAKDAADRLNIEWKTEES